MGPSYYFLTTMGDFTYFIWVFLLKHKLYAITIVHRFFNMIATQIQ